MKKLIKSSTEPQINLSEYEYVTNVDGYQIYRKIVTDVDGNSRGVWVAQDQDRQYPPFPITYRQARGYDAITEYESNAHRIGREIGEMLFSNTSIQATDSSGHHMTYTRNGQKFAVRLYSDDPMNPRFQITELHPYDDAEYAWAKCGYDGIGYIQFIRSGRKIDGMQCHFYEDDEYESPQEYIDELIDSTCVELLNLNKNVRPRMMYD